MFTHPNQPSMELTTKYNEKPMPQTQIHPKKKEKESTQQFQLAILLQSCNTQATKNNIDNNITKKKTQNHIIRQFHFTGLATENLQMHI